MQPTCNRGRWLGEDAAAVLDATAFLGPVRARERDDTAVERHAASIATLYFNPAASSPSWMASRTNTDSG